MAWATRGLRGISFMGGPLGQVARPLLPLAGRGPEAADAGAFGSIRASARAAIRPNGLRPHLPQRRRSPDRTRGHTSWPHVLSPRAEGRYICLQGKPSWAQRLARSEQVRGMLHRLDDLHIA